MKSNLSNWSGPAFILAGILWLAYCGLQAVAPAALTEEPYTVLNPTADAIYKVMLLLSITLFAVGLVGLYARQAGSAGPVGMLGLAAAILGGLLFTVGGVVVSYLEMDGAWESMMGGAVLLILSLFLLGVSTMSTQVLGRWSFVPLLTGVLMIAALAGGFMGLFQLEGPGAWVGASLAALVGVGWLLTGAVLISSGASASQEARLDSAPAQ